MSFDLFRSKVLHSALAAILIGSVFGASTLRAQAVDSVPSAPPQNTAPSDTTGERFPFSVETIKIEGGAELVTIFYRTNGTFDNRGPEESKFVPLLRVVRETVGEEVMGDDR